MQKLLLKNIKNLLGVYETAPKRLAGVDMKRLPSIENAWLACDNGIIADFGSMDDFPGITDWQGLEVIDCSGKIVMPCFADSHTHIVYAANREQEFVDRINGLSYEEIAKRGGGILNSAGKLRLASEDDLFEQSKERLKEIISQGTGAVEIKSGYGLNLESELKMLRVIRRLKDLNWIPVKATFLGAHAVPP
ncbi:MAG: imidazolonepropionase, partial [Bacteroidia bacterium]|nr:imidazolonepropionase [Bacteroidia bacterium]